MKCLRNIKREWEKKRKRTGKEKTESLKGKEGKEERELGTKKGPGRKELIEEREE